MVAGWQKIKITVKADGRDEGPAPFRRIDHLYSNGSLFATGYGHAVAYSGLNRQGRRAYAGFNPSVKNLPVTVKTSGAGIPGHNKNIANLEVPGRRLPFEIK